MSAPRSLTRTVCATGLALTLAAGLAGCVQESTPTTTDASSSVSGDPGSPSSTPTDTGTPFDVNDFTGRLRAAVKDYPTADVHVTVQLSDGQTATASGTQDIERDEMEMDVDVAGQKMTYRLVDGIYYMSQPPKWVRIDPKTAQPAQKEILDQFTVLSMKRQLDGFVAGVVAAGDKGAEEIEGVQTTHYTATVDVEKAVKAMGGTFSEGSPEQVIYDVWLDDKDLIARMDLNLNGAKATLSATRWGEPVDLKAPADSELAGQQG